MEEMLNSGIDGILRAYQLRVAGLTMEQHQVSRARLLFLSTQIHSPVRRMAGLAAHGAFHAAALYVVTHLTEDYTTGGAYPRSERPKKSGLSHLFEFPRRLRPKTRHRHKPRLREDTRIYRAGRRRTIILIIIIIIWRKLRLAQTITVVYDQANEAVLSFHAISDTLDLR